MKKTTLISALLPILFTTSLMYAADGGKQAKKKQLTFNGSGSFYEKYDIDKDIDEIEISTALSGSAMCEIRIPSSVQNINIKGHSSGSLRLIFYTTYKPTINTDQFSCSGSSQIQVMHPMRQYSYHAFAASTLLVGAWWYSSRID